MKDYRPSNTAEYTWEEIENNHKRLRAYRRRCAERIIDFLDGKPVPVNQIPRTMWMRRQAD